MVTRGVGIVSLIGCTCLLSCAKPILARDGTLVFQENGARGAAVVTANGVEFHDREDVPERVIHRDTSEPWRAPIGFILPSSGRFTETSRPTVVGTPGLAVVLRPSDTRVPSWGGEVLVRIDVLAPAAPGTARWGEDVVVVLDGRGGDTALLAAAALGQLGARDRVTVIDAHGPSVIVPTMPASNRSLAIAAIEKRVSERNLRPRDLAGAVRAARLTLGKNAIKRVLVLTARHRHEAISPSAQAELAHLFESHAAVTAVATHGDADADSVAAVAAAAGGTSSAEPSIEGRTRAVLEAIPPAGKLAFRDVVLTFEGTPAPSHVLEASGGDVAWRLDAGELALGDVRAGDERTEVVRATVPPWVPAEEFAFTVTARFDDLARGGERREMVTRIPCTYDDDIERIANSRHGDVIAYSSALATLRRLDAAFVGPGIDRVGGLYAIAQLHARSMSLLARDTRDRAIVEQAELLNALLAAEKK